MAQNAVQDANQNFSPIFAQGTLGTADVKGTSGVVSGAADPATGAQYVYNLGPAGEVALGDIQGGTIDQITTGSIVVTAGTVVTTMGDLSGGTIDLLTTGSISNLAMVHAGTINSGTINAGTVTTQPYPASQVQPAFVIGTAAIGTLVAAAGAGNGIYPNSVILTAMSGTLDMCLSFGLGSTSNQVVQRGLYAPGQGVAISFDNPSFYGTANSPLTYQILSGAGTASWAVTYNTKGTP